MYSARNLYDHI